MWSWFWSVVGKPNSYIGVDSVPDPGSGSESGVRPRTPDSEPATGCSLHGHQFWSVAGEPNSCKGVVPCRIQDPGAGFIDRIHKFQKKNVRLSVFCVFGVKNTRGSGIKCTRQGKIYTRRKFSTGRKFRAGKESTRGRFARGRLRVVGCAWSAAHGRGCM